GGTSADTGDHCYVAVIVGGPSDFSSEGDDLSLTTGRLVCTRLGDHLTRNGHTIPEFVKRGCDDDWGVYFESTDGEETFQFYIGYFPGDKRTDPGMMFVRYYLKRPFLELLFSEPERTPPRHSLHATMKEFGEAFAYSRMLSEDEFT